MQRLYNDYNACSFDPQEADQYKELLSALSDDTEGAADDVDEDGDLQMQRGNDVAPNRVCPLSMIEVSLVQKVLQCPGNDLRNV